MEHQRRKEPEFGSHFIDLGNNKIALIEIIIFHRHLCSYAVHESPTLYLTYGPSPLCNETKNRNSSPFNQPYSVRTI